jgi:hypothetical protein
MGMDDAKRRLAETQRLLEDDWQQIRETITKERRELAELQSAHQSRRIELEREREMSLQTAEERQAAFELQLKTIADQATELRTREAELAELREQWIGEKLEVEEIIRGLLVQLGQQAEGTATAPAQPAE